MRIHSKVCDLRRHLARQSNLSRQCPSEKHFLCDYQHANVMVLSSSGNVWAQAPIDVPLPPPSEVVYAM